MGNKSELGMKTWNVNQAKRKSVRSSALQGFQKKKKKKKNRSSLFNLKFLIIFLHAFSSEEIVLGTTLISFLAKSWVRRVIPLSAWYEAGNWWHLHFTVTPLHPPKKNETSPLDTRPFIKTTRNRLSTSRNPSEISSERSHRLLLWVSLGRSRTKWGRGCQEQVC